MRKFLSLLAVLMLCYASIFAQSRTISGKIADNNGQPIANASVKIKGSNSGTTAATDGSFKINANTGDVLEISAVGFAFLTTEVSSDSDLGLLTMAINESALAEVVVTAFGIKREKKALGYAVQEVKGDDLTIAKSTDLSSSLAGKVAGVKLIGSPSSSFDNADVIIRGVTGLGINPPLFIVDGTVSDQSAVIMDNVESLSVLKGPAATALYGQRAANGVIVITTKKGSRRKSSSVEVNLGVTTESLSIIPPYQDQYAGGYASSAGSKGSIYDDQGFYIFKYNSSKHPTSWAAFDGQRMLEYGADESWGPKMDGSQYRPYYSWYPGPDWAKQAPLTPQPDNIKDFFQSGRNLNNSIALTSGAENYNFRLTYGNQNRTLIIPGAKRDQHQLGLNGSFDISKRITISTDMAYTTHFTKGKPLEGYRLDGLNVTQNFNQWFQRQLDMKKMQQYRNEDGSLNSWNIGDPNGSSDISVYGQPQYWDNPYFVIKENFGTQKHSRLVGNVGLNINITKNLRLQSYARMNQYSNENDFRIATGGLQQDGYEITQNQYREMNYETNLLYKNRFGDFSVDGMVGANRRQEFFSKLYLATQGGLSSPNYFDISASVARPLTIDPNNPTTYQKKRVNSVYGKASFGFRDMLYLEGTLRNDWSSALPANNNSYLYPSISTSFIFTELMKSSSVSSWLTYGKVRASYASVGSDLNPHSLEIALNNGSFYGSNASVAIGNQFRDAEGIRPALTKAWEVGAELRFFNRFGIDFALYQNNNTDQIIPLDVSSSSGFSTAQVNAGNIVSKGVELSLSGTVIKARNFSWDVTVNWASNSNEVKELYPGLNNYLYATNRYDTRLEHRVGGEWGTYVGRKWRTDDQGRVLINYAKSASGVESTTGLPEYDINQEIGQVLPKWTGGVYSTFHYKAFDLAFSMDFQDGGLFYSETRNFNTGAGLSEETVGVNDKGHDWRDYPGAYSFATGNAGNGGYRIDGVLNDGKGTPNNRYLPARSYWYTARQREGSEVLLDASYIKLREVRLGYTIPQSILSKVKIAKSANIGLMVQNAWLIWATAKKYGVDPSELEVFYREGGQLSATRQIGANLRVTF